jgi:phospholipase C
LPGNRSFDEYFGTFPGATGLYDPNGASIFPQTGFAEPGGPSIPLLYPFRTSTFSSWGEQIPSLQHGPGNQRAAWASGAMNGWSAAQGSTALTTMGYFASNDIPYHWLLAQNFLLCDTYFCSVLGPTWPNRVFLMSGTVFGATPPAPGTLINYQGNPLDIPVMNNMSGGWPWQSYPAMLAQSQPSITWKIYDDQNWGPPWLAWQTPNATQVNPPSYLAHRTRQFRVGLGINMLAQLEDANGTIGGVGTASDPARYSATGVNDTQSKFEIDAQNGNLPDISWIVPPSFLTEHPSFMPADGECYLARIVEAVMAGEWENTILIITYDENDGHFDHVVLTTPTAPSTAAAAAGDEPWVTLQGSGVMGPGPVGAGFRVPTIIVSPWTVGGRLSSAVAPGVQFDHTSTIQYLEELWEVTCTNLPSGMNNN